ncbi:hypothetical protein FYK55_27355 [Roseiconus nitratireducens]|uniref:Uncharacterized protein n=1 Tax=Roseiconus nitratireducens TaxID=2605748 RepID=A0A5M6CTM4_9BACT|nr:hypothetical protein FYK55_27355 [Roseiconus nitratireducens]
MNRLQHRWDEIQRIEREAEVERQRQEYLSSDHYKAKQKQEQEEANADPTHPFHTVNIESITDRVHLADGFVKNRLGADKILKTFHQHCYPYVSSMKLSSQEEVNMKGKLKQVVIGKALKRLNDHYGSETKATRQELEVAIDEEASKIPGLGPIFNKS